jgi:hypothetical protein
MIDHEILERRITIAPSTTKGEQLREWATEQLKNYSV